MYAVILLLLTVGLAACSRGDSPSSSAITGPTEPQVVVNCLEDAPGSATNSGNTTITTTVDCGPRGSFNPTTTGGGEPQ
ncbi:MAG: hypothetical protein QN130_12440 [Armatimonadota bacterium]|nr:hypothetical protein [Armatimonadota bacterium]